MASFDRTGKGPSAPVGLAIEYIDRLIGDGMLKPGDPVSEPDIGKALGISRVPVREAIRILTGEDILVLVPNRSAQVRMLDPEEIIERFELLSWLSSAAIQRLVNHGNQHVIIDQLEQIGAEIVERSRKRGPLAVLRAMNRFNALIVAHCGSQYLQNMARRSRMNSYTRFVIEVFGAQTICSSASIYPRIAKAIAAGDGATASRIVTQRAQRIANAKLATLLADRPDQRKIA